MIFVIKLILFFCAGVLCKNIDYEKYSKDNGPLNLTPLVEKGEFDEARKLSSVDPTLFDGVDSHAAFFNVDKTKGNLFFWFFPAKGVPLESTPWIVWLQGGPGGSSLFGLFFEIGPIQIVNGTAQKRPITWGSNYSLLFIDNPVGAGFSYTEEKKYVTTEDEVGAALLNFIQQFLQVFPELRKAPLFIAGESYAGKYIPAFGHYIHHKNDSLPINLKGLAIGNGWTDPPTLMHYSEFSLQVGLTDPEQAQEIKEVEDEARKAWDEGDVSKFAYKATEAYALLITFSQVNAFNYLKEQTDPIIPSGLIKFLSRSDVRSAIHVGNVSYDALNMKVYKSLSKDMYLSVKPWLEELLEHYGVMCYSGQLDVIVAYALSVHTYRNLSWSGASDYLQAEREKIFADDELIGYVKGAGNFKEVLVRGASHMVPQDKPRAAKYIIDIFINEFK